MCIYIYIYTYVHAHKQWSPQEINAFFVLERECVRTKLQDKAVVIIQIWWRRLKGKDVKRMEAKIDVYDLKVQFKQTKRATQVCYFFFYVCVYVCICMI